MALAKTIVPTSLALETNIMTFFRKRFTAKQPGQPLEHLPEHDNSRVKSANANTRTRSLTNALPALLQGATESVNLNDGELTYDEFYAELKLLRLDARYFRWWEYRDELEAHLNITIEVKFVGQHTEPILAMLLTQEGKPGLLFRDPKTGDARMLVSGHLTEPAMLQIIYHELGHIAGGHELPLDSNSPV